MIPLLKLVFAIAVILLGAGFVRTAQLEHSPQQARFTEGTLPAPELDGFFRGNVRGYIGAWLGKKFSSSTSSGVNVFQDGIAQREKYPFKTSVGAGAHDHNLQVLKIDYNVSANPLWVRPILDEVVQTGKDAYFGKLELRLIPGYPFTLLFFDLNK